MECTFQLRTDQPDKLKRCTVILVLCFNNKRLRLSTGIKIIPQHWNTKTEQVVKAPQAKLLNARLLQISTAAQNHFWECSIHAKPITQEGLKVAVFPDKAPAPQAAPPTPIAADLIKSWQQANKGKLSENYLRHFEQVTGHLKAFTSSENKPEPTPDHITESFWQAYERYLLDTAKISLNSLNLHRKYARLVRQIAGLNAANWLKSKTVKTGIQKPALTWPELLQLHNCPVPEALKSEVDTFVFQALTGLRDGDMRVFTPADLQPVKVPGIGLTEVLTMPMQKTGETVTIPLHPLALEVFKKYAGRLVVYKQQVRNRYIKQAALQAELSREVRVGPGIVEPLHKLITTHTARRTCANLLYSTTEDLSISQQALGHTNPATTKIYVQQNDVKYLRAVLEAHTKFGGMEVEE